MLLLEYVEKFLADRDVSAIYQMQVRVRCRMLEEFAGRPIPVAELTCELVNAWLAAAKEKKLSAYTVATYRANVLAVWNAAYQDNLNDCPPLRLRPIKRPRLLVRAYTRAEIRQLLAHAATLRGKHRDGNLRKDFWRAAIHAAYSTGLRRGDLLRIFKRDISDDGSVEIIQSKTEEPHSVWLSPESLCYAGRLKDANGLLLPWPHRLDAMVWAFRRIRNAAGVKRGSLSWLRKSAGSYADAENPGSGRRLLGHRTDAVFTRHYEDRSITRASPVSPPPL